MVEISHTTRSASRRIEWPTLGVAVATYGAIGFGGAVWSVSPALSVLIMGLALTQYSSLQHEVLHGHPFARQWMSEALVFPAMFVVIPYMRFKDTHLAHHHDPSLTDPYDDPESNFFDPSVWAGLPRWLRVLFSLNGSLAGRMVLGPAIGTAFFLREEVRLLVAGDRRAWLGWAMNALGLVPLIWFLSVTQMALWAYAAAVYIAIGLLRIRTYLEHRAHESHRARTVVVEDRGPLSVLFLNNNFHVVHHMHPNVAWYDLPALYAARRDHFLRRNEGYRYKNYDEVFRRYFFTAKDPMPHPLWPVKKDRVDDTPFKD